MNRQFKYGMLLKYVKFIGLSAAVLIVTASTLKAHFYEPADFHIDYEQIEHEANPAPEKDDRFPDSDRPEFSGWV